MPAELLTSTTSGPTAAEIDLLRASAGNLAPQPAPAAHAVQMGARILIVDDEPINVKVVRKHLAGVGYQDFLATSNATEVLSLMVRQVPDLVLLDVVMPQVNGLDLLAAIRADERLTRIPVVILTASSDRDTKVRALELGATDFLAKPVDPSELVLRVRNALLIKTHQDYL